MLIAEESTDGGMTGPVGLICMKLRRDIDGIGGNGELVHMCVHSTWRRRGLARTMLKEVIT